MYKKLNNLISKYKLKNIIVKIFKKHGLSNGNSKICADALINAELVGTQSHGVVRLKMYCDRIKKKVINPKPQIKIKKISKSISLVDANNGIGFIAADKGIKQAIKNAKKTGIGLVGVKNSGHYGLSSYYIEQAVKKKFIAMCFTNAPPAIAPYGSKKSLFGTNPIAFGVPTFNNKPFIFDSSMSKINRGKIRVAAAQGKKIPHGVALDRDGSITTNAKKALDGVQLPFGDFRGSGLAWVVDILSGAITGSAHCGNVKDPYDDFSGPQNVGHLFIVFKANIFNKNFKKEINKNIQTVKKLPKVKGVTEIKYPGQRKYERYLTNIKSNIYLPKNLINELEILLKE